MYLQLEDVATILKHCENAEIWRTEHSVLEMRYEVDFNRENRNVGKVD